jgi:phage N-6-adenine-methyltransferase
VKATAQHQLFELTRIDWATPQELFDELDAEFGFVLDVCASADNAKCDRYFTIEQDGLRQVWAPGPCWMNPPYGREIGKWTSKARRASEAGITVVGLVPARTDTAWWHDDCIDQEVRFLRGRVRFSGGGPAPFPSAVVVWTGKAVEPLGTCDGCDDELYPGEIHDCPVLGVEVTVSALSVSTSPNEVSE